MKRETKVENCSCCDGDGWVDAKKGSYYTSDFISSASDYSTVIGKEGCTSCGGSGVEMFSKRDGKNTLRKGSGKVKRTYEAGTVIKEEPAGGCFLSTACIEHKGLTDDCIQLKVLRDFRDDYVLKTEGGIEKVKLYYMTSPLIVSAISESDNKVNLLNDVYLTIELVIEKVLSKENNEAMSIYERMFFQLAKDLNVLVR